MDALKNILHLGLVMARTYAICSNSRVVLVVLGILLLGFIVLMIVCDYICIIHCEALTSTAEDIH